MAGPVCRCRTCRENGTAGPTLEPVLMRLPPAIITALRELSKRTRVPQAEYAREAIADLLAKYGAMPAAPKDEVR